MNDHATPPPAPTGVRIIANVTMEYNGVELHVGALVRCPRCGRLDNWELGGHGRWRLWECFHGSVELAPFLADIVTFPQELAY